MTVSVINRDMKSAANTANGRDEMKKTKSWQDLTDRQMDNFLDWSKRVQGELGMNLTEACQHFNGSNVDFQQYVLRHPWVRYCGNSDKNVPIKRDLLKQSRVGARAR